MDLNEVMKNNYVSQVFLSGILREVYDAINKKIPGCIFAEKLILENGPPSLKLRRIEGELQP